MADKNKTHLVFIIDRSGSMLSLQEATRKGFNEFMNEQRNAAGSATITVILFDDRYEILYDNVDVKNIPDLDSSVVLARGTTALRDAIGRAILNTKEHIQKMNEDDKPEKVLFIITTDGADNASTDFDKEKLTKAIDFQRSIDGWEFIFTGADATIVETAKSYNIPAGNTLTYSNTDVGIKNAYCMMAQSSTMYRCASKTDDTTNLFSQQLKNES